MKITFDELTQKLRVTSVKMKSTIKQTKVCTKTSYFFQEYGFLNKDDLLQFIKKNERNFNNVLDIKCC